MTTTSRPEFGFARRQHGLVTTAQLRAAGLSPAAIDHRARSERLHLIHPGVFAVGRPELTREGRWLAAVLACGPRAVLSHLAAARLWGIIERGGARPHVTVPTRAGVSAPEGIELHRSGTLSDADVTVRHGIPVTGLVRTLIDLAGVLDQRALKAAVRQAVRLHRLDLAGLRAAVDTPRRDHRRARLRAVLDLYVPREELTESELEARFLELCTRHRLPVPKLQWPVGRHRADFAWPDMGLVVETDGRDHLGPVALLDDRVKDRALKAAGLEVLRFTWAEVVNRPAAVAREIRAAIARLRRAGRVNSGRGRVA